MNENKCDQSVNQSLERIDFKFFINENFSKVFLIKYMCSFKFLIFSEKGGKEGFRGTSDEAEGDDEEGQGRKSKRM